MNLNFRQGLVSFQASGALPQFLLSSSTAGYIDINVSPSPLIVTIAHGSSNYLLKFDASILAAFGPMISGLDNYLFLELNLLSGEILRKISVFETIVSPTEPGASSPGTRWFDTTANVMKTRNSSGTKFIDTPGIVIGKVQGGNTSQIVPGVVGSTVGLNTQSSSGFILYDSLNRPVRTSTGELMTTDSSVSVKTSVGTSGILSHPISTFFPVRAAEPIPRMSLVYLSGEDSVSLASSNPATIGTKMPVGIVQLALATNEIGTVTQVGEISWDQWNFSSADFGKPLYCGFNGEVQITRPQGYQVFRVGYIKNSSSIIFGIDSETLAQVVSQPGSLVVGAPPLVAGTTINGSGETVTVVSMPASSDTVDGYMSSVQASQVSSMFPRLQTAETNIVSLTSSKSNVGHGHPQSDVVNLVSDLSAMNVLIGNKLSKVSPATAGHFASLLSDGSLEDAGAGAIDFASSVHTHNIANVVNLQTELNNRSLITHTHVIANVVGLQGILDSKAPLIHTHIISSITGLQGILDSKVNNGQSIPITDVTGLQVILDGKVDIGSIVISDVVGLSSALTNKSDVGHTHSLSSGDITDVNTTGATTGKTLVFNGTQWVPGASTPGFALSDSIITDVNTAGALSGETLVWDGAQWLPGTRNPVFALSDSIISDVNTAGVSLGETLVWSGSQWLPGTRNPVFALSDSIISDVNTAGVSDGQSLVWSTASSQWLPGTRNPVFALSDSIISDVNTAGASSGQALVWNGTQWLPSAVTSTAAPFALSDNLITDLDTSTTPPNMGNVLMWNSAKWVPGAAQVTISNVSGLQTALDGKASSVHTHIISDITGLQTALDGKAYSSHIHFIADVSGLQSALDSKAFTAHNHTLASGAITDVDTSTTAPTNGQALVWETSSSTWVPGTIAVSPAPFESQCFSLTGTFAFDSILYGSWNASEIYTITSPMVSWNSTNFNFDITDGGVYIVSVSTSLNAYLTSPDDSPWPDGLTAFGIEVQVSAGATVVGPKKSVHTRLGDTVTSAQNNASLSGLTNGQELQSPSFTDEFMIMSSAAQTLDVKAFAGVDPSPSMSVDANIRITIRKVSNSTPI
jgi:hypothetical protein